MMMVIVMSERNVCWWQKIIDSQSEMIMMMIEKQREPLLGEPVSESEREREMTMKKKRMRMICIIITWVELTGTNLSSAHSISPFFLSLSLSLTMMAFFTLSINFSIHFEYEILDSVMKSFDVIFHHHYHHHLTLLWVYIYVCVSLTHSSIDPTFWAINHRVKKAENFFPFSRNVLFYFSLSLSLSWLLFLIL